MTGALSLWGGPANPSCLLDRFRHVVEMQPETTALVDEENELTYAQLCRWVGEIAALLANHGVRSGDRVAVIGRRSAAVVAGFLGTVAAGATYVPLDPEYPTKRLAYMLEDSGARLVLHEDEQPEFAASVQAVRIPRPRTTTEGAEASGWLPVECQADLPIYVIYTSGTTGWPKGVAIQHSCLDNMVQWQWNHSVRPDLRTAQFAPLNFDVYFQEVLGTLCGGGTLVVVPERLRRDPFSLLSWLAQDEIERVFLPYLALNMLAMAASAEESLEHLNLLEVNTAGEQLVCTAAIRELFARMPFCRLNNHYGQSESAMVTAHTLTGSSESWPALPPIGVPLPGCELLIESVDPAEPEVGELLVAGLAVSLGYLNQELLNADRYITIDSSPQGHTRAFRTGDLVRLSDGVVQFLSRRDHDVKIRGFRVNLREVDVWLLEQPGVVEAACVAVERPDGPRSLRAVVMLEDGTELDETATLVKLAEVLPAQSVPVSIAVVDSLPRTASGKIDRERIGREFIQGFR